MLSGLVNQIEESDSPDNTIPDILHGSKNVFIKKHYLNSRSDYQRYFVINTSRDMIKSHTILYKGTPALRRIYSGIPHFVPADADHNKIEQFRKYVAAL